MYLSKDPDQNGSITFGGYDLLNYAKKGASEQDIFWGQINPSEKFWNLPMNGISFSGKDGPLVLNGATSRNAIFDTGVSYAIIPAKDFLAI